MVSKFPYTKSIETHVINMGDSLLCNLLVRRSTELSEENWPMITFLFPFFYHGMRTEQICLFSLHQDQENLVAPRLPGEL